MKVNQQDRHWEGMMRWGRGAALDRLVERFEARFIASLRNGHIADLVG